MRPELKNRIPPQGVLCPEFGRLKNIFPQTGLVLLRLVFVANTPYGRWEGGGKSTLRSERTDPRPCHSEIFFGDDDFSAGWVRCLLNRMTKAVSPYLIDLTIPRGCWCICRRMSFP